MTRKLLALAAFTCLLAGCGNPPPPPAPSLPPKAPPIDGWVLTTLDPNDFTPALLWNGLLGFRFGRDGGCKGQPFFNIDVYETKGEEKMLSMVSPLPNGFLVDGNPLVITGGYKQSLDMKTATLSTQWRSGSITVDCVTILHPTKRILVQKWTLRGNHPDQHVAFDLGTYGNVATDTTTEKDFQIGPSNIPAKLKVIESQSPNPTVELSLALGQAPNPPFHSIRTQTFSSVKHVEPPITPEPFAQVETETKKIWADRWKTDIEIDGPPEDQQAVRSFLFYLRSAIAPDSGMSISPFGLSNQMYNGHVFWDADIWIFPALALVDPELAESIPLYRKATFLQAVENAKKASLDVHPSDDRAKYAWESSVTGKETVVGSSEKEVHISGDVAWSLNQASELGLMPFNWTIPIRQKTAAYLRSLSNLPSGSKECTIPNVMSPDETHTGDNDLYTNLLAQWTLTGFQPAKGQPQYKLPHDDKTFLTYDNDPVKAYKQAAAVLSIYPLQYPPAEKQAKQMMDRFADKVIKNGPAMSDSVHALIWARLGESDKAYDTWQKSWQPFTKQSLLLFSEKRTKPTTYFTTGAGGSLQTVLFGFLGFRLDSNKEQGAAWSKKLLGDSWLSIKPNLPKAWKSVKLKNFSVLGQRYTLTATHRPSGPDAAEVTKGE